MLWLLRRWTLLQSWHWSFVGKCVGFPVAHAHTAFLSASTFSQRIAAVLISLMMWSSQLRMHLFVCSAKHIPSPSLGVSTFSSDIAELVSGEWQHITGVAPRQLLKKRFSYGTAIKMLQRFSRKRLDHSHKTSRTRIAASGHSLHEHAERLERKRSRYFLLRPEMLTGSRALLCSSAAMWTWIDLRPRCVCCGFSAKR